ncbi:MAG: anthranilate phosphoribosyltransferase [Granulosicoccaceae bacterium]
MKIQEAIAELLKGNNLSGDAMQAVMRQIMTGDATPAQIGGFLIGLRIKGETVDEIAAAADVMSGLAEKVVLAGDEVVDIVGTGGDSSGTFNISTASSIVAAAAGATVAKHGNRSISSKSGAADLFEQAGVNIELTAEQVRQCIEATGLGFMFAPKHHSAMKYAAGPRREMGVRTIFNVLGPLTNPAGAKRQLIGVFAADLVEPIARVFARLGSIHTMVVHAKAGLDEIGISGETYVSEMRDGEVNSYTIKPTDFGLVEAPMSEIQVEDSLSSLAMIKDVFSGAQSAARDTILLNAGAGIYVSGRGESLAAGIELAASAIDSGEAAKKLEQLAQFSSQFKVES